MMKRLSALAQSPVGRWVAVLAGLAVVVFLVERSGPERVWAAVTRAPALFFLVWLLEFGVVGAESWAAVLLYGPARHKIPRKELLRSSLFCYSLMVVVPFGRPAGEATRAALLSRYVGFPLAAASAARMQALTLLGNAFISVPCAIGVLFLSGPSWLAAAVGGNFLLTLVLGIGLLLAGRHTRLGTRIGKYFAGGSQWGTELDGHLQSELRLAVPLTWVFMSRGCRTVQRTVLLAAVGGAFGILPTLGSEAINLIAGVVGDAIPLQVGVTEAGYAFASQVLSMTASDAIAMALIVHIAQLTWVGIGFLSPLLAPPPQQVPTE